MQKNDIALKTGEKERATPVAKQQKPKIDYSEMAKERNARTILHHTPDTYPLTDMARYADQGLTRLRNRIMISLAPKDALPLLDEYNEALFHLHTVVAKICEITGVRYRTPRVLAQIFDEKISKTPAAESEPGGRTAPSLQKIEVVKP